LNATQDHRIHVAAACDANYALPLAVMLASIEANLGSDRTVVAHVLDSGLDDAARLKVASSVDPRRIEIEWIPVEPRQLAAAAGTLRSFDTISLASYNRLLLPGVLPDALDRVIYLDCDLVVLHDLADLWETDIGGHSLGSVRELLERARYASAPSGVRRYRELGLRADLELFNAGVMLINLARWRETLLGPRAFHYLREAGSELRWHDQEALNVVVAGDWLPLDLRWNVTMHAYRGEPDPSLVGLVERPRIVHYNAAIKPWQPHFRLAHGELFFRYLDATAWAGWRPEPLRHAVARRIAARLIRMQRKLAHATTRHLRREWTALSTRRTLRRIEKSAGWKVPKRSRDREIRAFVRVPASAGGEPELVARLLAHGADRVFPYCAGDRDWPLHLRRLLRDLGEGHWCLAHDHDEWLVGPHSTLPSLADFREYLERHGYEALECYRGPAPDSVQPATFRRLDLTLSDPVSGRMFVSPVYAEAATRLDTQLDCRSRIAMFSYRRDLVIDRELRGLHAARLADIAGLLRPVERGSVPLEQRAAGLARSSPQFAAYAQQRLMQPA
jgi:lipopolysaccharide biosynthesis glycosyltransferase